jgi:hypothetical protein
LEADGIAGDVARTDADGEQVPAVVADLHPARRGLPVGVRRGPDRAELAEAYAVRGEPLAASRRPPASRTKLSIREVLVRMPLR